MPYSVNIIRLLDKVEPPLREVLIEILAEIERQRKQWEESVTKTEFNELKDIVADLAKAQNRTEQKLKELAEAQKKTEQRVNELAEAQKKTEQRLDSLTQRVNELAEAQKKTEKRLNELAEAQRKTEQRLDSLTQRVNELAEAQRKTEQRLDSLTQRVNELAEAQKKTEKRLNELAEAQKKTEQRVNELAEAQKKTEEELRKLVGEHRKTREELGGLSHTVGYILEDKSYEALPSLLKKDFGIEVEELKRDFIEISPNRYEEINIIGKGKKNGTQVWILGECKTQLKKRDVDSFLKKVSRIEHLFPGEKVFVAVTYQTSPQVRHYTEEKGIKLYFSYQLRS